MDASYLPLAHLCYSHTRVLCCLPEISPCGFPFIARGCAVMSESAATTMLASPVTTHFANIICVCDCVCVCVDLC